VQLVHEYCEEVKVTALVFWFLNCDGIFNLCQKKQKQKTKKNKMTALMPNVMQLDCINLTTNSILVGIPLVHYKFLVDHI
jgi:hypothetical protein